MHNALVSIIIPCFNQAAYLDAALQSVLNQSYPHWECIVVNDGSTDATQEIVANWLQKDKRFTYVYKANGGLSSARNVGINMASGYYMLFLDSDDYLDSNKLEIQIQDLKANDISISDYKAFQDGTNEKVPQRYLPPEFSKLKYKKEIIWDWEYRKSFPPHCVLFKHRLLQIHGLRFNEALANHEDWEFWVKLFYYSEGVFNNPAVLSFYRIRAGSMSSNHVPMRQGFLKAAKSLEAFFKAENQSELYMLAKHKYKEIYERGRVSLWKQIKLKVISKLARLYRYVRKD